MPLSCDADSHSDATTEVPALDATTEVPAVAATGASTDETSEMPGPGDAETDIKQSANRSELPIALVAIFDGNICGTAALKMESVTTYPDYFPWLAGLLVAPAYRKQGVGEQLIVLHAV